MASMDRMPGPGSYTNGMPSRSQQGRVMKDSFDQHDAHRPRPSTVSRHAGQSCGSARSSAERNTPRTAPAARRIGLAMAMLSDGGIGSGYRRAAAMSSPRGEAMREAMWLELWLRQARDRHAR